MASAEELKRLIGVVERKLAALPAVSAGDYESLRCHHSAAAAALDELAQDFRAKSGRQADAVTLSFGGVRSSSTGGPVGVMRNWLKAARRRVEEAS